MTTLNEQLPPALVKPPVWGPIGRRFPDVKECLASFLALEGAEVLAGAKPANLVNIADRARACGRNPRDLWHRYGREVLAASPLCAATIQEDTSRTLLLLYRPDLLTQELARPEIRCFLMRQGYPASGTEATLDVLKGRFSPGRVPHEIGVFLGYPLKDVEGFMGIGGSPLSCRGPWQIYGDPRPSIRLVRSHRLSRARMAHQLARTTDPMGCLREAWGATG